MRMKLEDVTERIVRIIKKVESCGWSDRSGTCSKDCPLWNSTEPGKYCDALAYLKNEKIKEFSERITNIFREEYSEEIKEQLDDVIISGDKKEITIEDVTEYLNGMIKECRTFCEKHHCNRCKINEHNSKICSLLSLLEDYDTKGMLKYADKIIKSGDFEIYPNPSDTVRFFIQTKIEDAESEFEKKEYLEILKQLRKE